MQINSEVQASREPCLTPDANGPLCAAVLLHVRMNPEQQLSCPAGRCFLLSNSGAAPKAPCWPRLVLLPQSKETCASHRGEGSIVPDLFQLMTSHPSHILVLVTWARTGLRPLATLLCLVVHLSPFFLQSTGTEISQVQTVTAYKAKRGKRIPRLQN